MSFFGITRVWAKAGEVVKPEDARLYLVVYRDSRGYLTGTKAHGSSITNAEFNFRTDMNARSLGYDIVVTVAIPRVEVACEACGKPLLPGQAVFGPSMVAGVIEMVDGPRDILVRESGLEFAREYDNPEHLIHASDVAPNLLAEYSRVTIEYNELWERRRTVKRQIKKGW